MTAPKRMPPTPEPAAARGPILVLRDADQRTVAVLVLLAAACIVIPYWRGFDGVQDIGSFTTDPAEPVEFYVDVNRADQPELMLLPEIGETLANRIIASRDTDGPFRRAEDLLRVRGIGAKKLVRIQPHLRFDPSGSPGARR